MKKIILILTVCFVISALTACGQYNKEGISYYLDVTEDETTGMQQIGEIDGFGIYIFNLSECNVKTSDGKSVSLESVITEGKVTVEELISKLQTESEGSSNVYFGDGYQITVLEDSAVVSPDYSKK